MALAQRKLQTYTNPTIDTTEAPIKKTPIRPARKLLSKGEKVLFMLFGAIVIAFSVMILHTQAQINDTNKEVQVISKQIEETTKQNTELSFQVSEKSTYEVIWEKAKALGLDLNEKNVKVVSGQ